MKKKLLSSLLLLGILLLILGFVALNNIAPYAIVQPPRVTVPIDAQLATVPHESLEVLTKDSILLKGYWIKSNQEEPKGILIFVHGIGGCKEHFFELAQELAALGIESMLFDGRAHGESGGQFCTYGFKEKKDIAQLVDHIKAKAPDLPIGIWGNSLGGAIALQALELDPRIEFGLIESTFTDLSQIVFDYKKRYLKGFGIKALSDFALQRAGEIANFDPKQVQPIQSVQHIQQPIFLAHGDTDKSIHVDYGKQLFEQLASKDKELVVVEGGGHFSLYEKGGQAYKQKIMQFIGQQLEGL